MSAAADLVPTVPPNRPAPPSEGAGRRAIGAVILVAIAGAVGAAGWQVWRSLAQPSAGELASQLRADPGVGGPGRQFARRALAPPEVDGVTMLPGRIANVRAGRVTGRVVYPMGGAAANGRQASFEVAGLDVGIDPIARRARDGLVRRANLAGELGVSADALAKLRAVQFKADPSDEAFRKRAQELALAASAVQGEPRRGANAALVEHVRALESADASAVKATNEAATRAVREALTPEQLADAASR